MTWKARAELRRGTVDFGEAIFIGADPGDDGMDGGGGGGGSNVIPTPSAARRPARRTRASYLWVSSAVRRRRTA